MARGSWLTGFVWLLASALAQAAEVDAKHHASDGFVNPHQAASHGSFFGFVLLQENVRETTVSEC